MPLSLSCHAILVLHKALKRCAVSRSSCASDTSGGYNRQPAAVAASMGPTKATGCRYLGAARGVADMATAVGPAVAVAFGLASTARYLAELGAAVMEAAVVQPSTVRAIRIETAVRGQSFFAQIKDSRPRMFFPWW